MADGLERQLAPVSQLLFEAAELRPGERVVDVGCGTGPTTRRAAELVGATGAVTGLDVSAEMLAAARESAPLAGIDWVEADATTWDGPSTPFDVVVSRFGVMFFADPAAAFANLARMTAPGGRMRLAVWGSRPASALFELPMSIAVRAVERQGHAPAVPPADGGPFSLGDTTVVEALLTGAGWRAVSCASYVVALPVGGGLGPAEAAAAAMELGPTRVVTELCSESERAEVVEAIADHYASLVDDAGHVVLDGAVVIVSAATPSAG